MQGVENIKVNKLIGNCVSTEDANILISKISDFNASTIELDWEDCGDIGPAFLDCFFDGIRYTNKKFYNYNLALNVIDCFREFIVDPKEEKMIFR